MNVIISQKLTRTKDWINPVTGKRERIITHPDGRIETIDTSVDLYNDTNGQI